MKESLKVALAVAYGMFNSEQQQKFEYWTLLLQSLGLISITIIKGGEERIEIPPNTIPIIPVPGQREEEFYEKLKKTILEMKALDIISADYEKMKKYVDKKIGELRNEILPTLIGILKIIEEEILENPSQETSDEMEKETLQIMIKNILKIADDNKQFPIDSISPYHPEDREAKKRKNSHN